MSVGWCNSSKLRRHQIESGLDITFNKVFKPIFLEKIANLSPINIIEIGSGTGHLSKELSKLPYKLTAIEPSLGMFEVAKDVLKDSNVCLINCSSFDLSVSKKYDLAFTHLVAHVVDDLNKFLLSIARHLNSGGYLIFSIPHPCFYNDYKKIFNTEEYNYMKLIKKNISFTITKDQDNEISEVPYHHRPLSDYINNIIKTDFTIDSFEEIYPEKMIQMLYGATWDYPRYCLFSCRKN